MIVVPIISVIIPIKNGGKSLTDCLNSLEDQSNQNFEILLMDGASSDDSLVIAESFQLRMPNLIIQSSTDNGIYDAMNAGIKLAKGKWLYFLGSDDQLYSKDVLSNVAMYLTDAVDIVYGDVVSSRWSGRYSGEFNLDIILHKNICHQAIFFKQSVFNHTGLFNRKYRLHADWDHNMKWLGSPKLNSLYIDQVIANYADGGQSSLGIDTKFLIDKKYNFLSYSQRSLSSSQVRRLSKTCAREALSKLKIWRVVICIKLYLSSYLRQVK